VQVVHPAPVAERKAIGCDQIRILGGVVDDGAQLAVNDRGEVRLMEPEIDIGQAGVRVKPSLGTSAISIGSSCTKYWTAAVSAGALSLDSVLKAKRYRP
jgi:hypothetical protein